MSHQIQKLFTDIAPTYDKLNHVLSLNSDKVWRKKTIQSIRSDPHQKLIALDLCAGTLDLSLKFLDHYKRSVVYAVDFSYRMLRLGQKKIPSHQLKHLCTVCADALHLPFQDKQFDVVFCGYGFRNLDDKEAALKEIRRILKPQGQILLLDFFRPQNFFSKLFHATYGKIILPSIGRMISGHSDAYTYLYRSITDFYSTKECEKILSNQGFINITINNYFNGISSLIYAFKS